MPYLRLTPAIAILGTLMVPVSRVSAAVEATVTPPIKEYCHIVRFPQGWTVPAPSRPGAYPLFYGFDSSYEFRVPGLLETTFLVGGLVLPEKEYAINKYKVDLADPRAIAVRATEREWQEGTKIPDSRNSDRKTFANVHITSNDQLLPFNGFQFDKGGDFWEGAHARLSPDRSLIVILSSSGKVARRDEFTIFGGRDIGKLFFDVYNADTGKKLITVTTRYRDVEPGNAINQSIWVEHYFIVPLGEHRERCLVCDFSRLERKRGETR